MKAALFLLVGLTAPTLALAQHQPERPLDQVKSKPQTILGVLEDVPDEFGGHSHGVRIVFEKGGKDWRAFPTCGDTECLKTVPQQYPQQITWGIAYDAKNMGQVTGRTPTEFSFYSHVGLQEVDNGPIPTVGQRSVAYGGWSGTSVYRPLIANSQPYFSDPESWKPSQLTPERMASFRHAFRRRFPKLCTTSKADETKLQPFSFRDEDLKIIKAYADKDGWTIARVRLLGAIDCTDTEAGDLISDRWFSLDPSESARYIGEGMWLVDAGDYDNDGLSELVFAIDRYNRGGYELFYDHFKKHATFEYSYH